MYNKLFARIFIIYICLFLYVVPTRAAKETPNPDFKEEVPLQDQRLEVGSDKLDLIEISPAPKILKKRPEEKSDYFFPYSKSLSARVGYLFDNQKFSDKSFIFFGGVILQLRQDISKYYDLGIDLTSDATANIHAERRWIYTRTKFRPYTKAGLGLNLKAEEQLTTFIRINNYQLRWAIGFEQLYLNPMSWRFEFEAFAGLGSVGAQASVGYSWAW